MTLTDAIKAEESSKIVMPRRNEKENTTEFVAKKREMFLVQMSLDTKREEIRKLEEKAQMKEEALQRSEQMLEEDAMRFDAFLKENDKKAPVLAGAITQHEAKQMLPPGPNCMSTCVRVVSHLMSAPQCTP